MSKDSDFMKAVKRLASDALDVMGGAVTDAIKQEIDLPRQRRRAALPNPRGFRTAVDEFAEASGFAPRWYPGGTFAVLTVPHAGGRWQIAAIDDDDTVQLVVNTSLRFDPESVPYGLAIHVLTRNTGIPFGGYELHRTAEGLALRCRASLPADALTGELIEATITALIADVADLFARLDR